LVVLEFESSEATEDFLVEMDIFLDDLFDGDLDFFLEADMSPLE
jgi:hypothetical protein